MGTLNIYKVILHPSSS